MKIFKRIIVITVIILAVFLMVDIKISANTIVESVEEGTWLNKQFELYGVPVGISTAIGGAIGSFLTWLVSKKVRDTIKFITGGFKDTTSTLKIANNNVAILTDSVSLFKDEMLIKLDNVVNIVLELAKESKETILTAKQALSEVAVIKDELKIGALKIINSLTEANSEENEV